MIAHGVSRGKAREDKSKPQRGDTRRRFLGATDGLVLTRRKDVPPLRGLLNSTPT